MNTYSKFVPNVFLAKCSEQYSKGDIINVTTKYGKENPCEVFNLIYEKDGNFFYSIARADGFNVQERAKNKAEKYTGFSANAARQSDTYYTASNKDADFLRLGEPIKIGHHSEKRHRRIIEQANNNMSKSVGFMRKAEEYSSKAESWEAKADTINLSMPESIDYFEKQLQTAIHLHEGLKSGQVKRSHSFSLTYAKKEVNDLKKKVLIAKRLWS